MAWYDNSFVRNYVALGLFQPNPAEGGFRDLTGMLRAQAMGQGPSLVDEQYKRALEAGGAQQRSVAAGARPGQTAMAQRLASQGIGQLGADLGSQSMLAKIMEREKAQQMYLQALMGQAQVPQFSDKLLGLAGGAAQAYMKMKTGGAAGGAAPTSDERAKKNIRSGRSAADELLDALKPKTFRYKDTKADGDGRRLGVMAQALEKTRGAKHTVITTASGKKVLDAGHLTATLAGAVGRLNEKIEKLAKERRHAALGR